ncbi:hypothetical protein LTR17_022435 [Elasticomyces elasticus]|nr:hypothetical protein LTR17_022435 [Elasticomyces elasticus]
MGPGYTHALYVTGATVLATAATTFTLGQIKRLWLAYELTQPSQERYGARLRRAKVLLGISGILDHAKSWEATASLVVTSLITAAVVAGITPSQSVAERGYTLWMSTEDYRGCYPAMLLAGRPDYPGFTRWESNGSDVDWRYHYMNTTYNSSCPAWDTKSRFLADALPIAADEQWAYKDGGTLVAKSAMGVPYDVVLQQLSIESNKSLNTVFEAFTEFRGCLPVMVMNPVQCRPNGTVQVEDHSVTAVNGGNGTMPVYSVNPRTQGASAAGFPSDSWRYPNDQIKILLGSVNDHANLLAQMMWDFPALESGDLANGYAVECEMTFGSEYNYFDWTMVVSGQLSNISNLETALKPSSYLYGTGPCLPEDLLGYDTNRSNNIRDFMTTDAVVAAATAWWPLLNEGAYQDGWWNILYQVTDRLAKQPSDALNGTRGSLLFLNSRNPLEDMLGLATAMTIGSFYGSANGTHGPGHGQPTTLTYTRTRLGPGKLYSLVLLLPELYAIWLLFWLDYQLSRIKSIAVHKHDQAELWKTPPSWLEIAKKHGILWHFT